MNKKIILSAAGVLAAIIIGVVLYFGNFFDNDPRTAVLRAAANTLAEVNKPETSLMELYRSLTAEPWRQEVSFSVGKPGGSLLPDIDPRILAVTELLTLRHTARSDTHTRKRIDHIAAQLAVTTLLELEIHTSPNEMAFTIPQAIDYFLHLDPRRVAREWDESLLGTYMGSIDGVILEGPFYDYYNLIMFPEKSHTLPVFMEHVILLDDGAQYKRLENDLYEVTLTREAANAFLQAVNLTGGLRFPNDLIGEAVNALLEQLESIRFESDITAEIQLDKNKIHRISAETRLMGQEIKIEVSFKGQPAKLDNVEIVLDTGGNSALLQIQSDVGNPESLTSHMTLKTGALALGWDIQWDKKQATGDNFKFNAYVSEEGDFSLDIYAGGSLKTDSENGFIDADIKNAGFSLGLPQGGLETSLNGRYLLRAHREPVTLTTESRPLAGFNELDLLLVFGKLASHPQLGDLIGGFLPF
jgi:hypothetical protein